MRFTEIILSIPNLLLIIFLQAIMGKATIGSISIVIGLTSWFGIAKIIRTEVRQLRSSEYVIAAKCMGGSFWHILWKHLAPNFVSSIMFMVVMNVRPAIVAESTLSFLGIGLPLDVISWGSMLSLAEKSTDVESLVDRSNSGNFSGGRIDVYYQSGALASGESQPSGSKIITPSICDGKRMIEILQ